MSDLRISMAFELYDRTMPFIDGSVKPVGTEPQMLAIYEGTRHPRMLDHLEFDVDAPQRLGLRGVWIDRSGQGLPKESKIRPYRIVRSFGELTAARD